MEFIPTGSNWARIGGKVGAGLAQPLNRAVDLLQHEKLQELERRSVIKNKNAEMENFVEQARRFGMPESFISAAAPQRPEDRFKAMQLGPQFEAYREMEQYKNSLRPLIEAYDRENQMAQHQRGNLEQQQEFMQQGPAQAPQHSPTGAQSEPAMQQEAYDAAGINPQKVMRQGSGNPYRDEFERIQQAQNNLLSNGYKTPTDKYREQKLGMEAEKMAQKESLEQEKLNLKKQEAADRHFKEVRAASEPYEKKAEASEANIRDYDQIADLALDDEVRSGNLFTLLSKMGVQDFSRDTPTQLAEKIIARLGQNAQSAFGTGTRITNFLEKTFQRSLPSLYNTNEGIWTIAQINKLNDQANILKNDIRQQILSENNYRLPPDLDDQINKRAKPQIKQLEDEVKKIMSNHKELYKDNQQLKIANDYPYENPGFFDDGTPIYHAGKKLINFDSKKWMTEEEYEKRSAKKNKNKLFIPKDLRTPAGAYGE